MPNPSEPTKFDAAVSEACTRSGAFALLISLVLIFLIPYWIGRPKEVALGQYLSARFNLAVTVDRLEDDPVFQRYKTSSEAAESTSIAKLIGLNVDMSAAQANAPKTTSNPVASQALRDHPVVNTAVKPSPLSTVRRGRLAAPGPPGPVRFAPSPAINLTVKILYTIDELPVIADLMGKLNDSELLALSRQDSNFFDASIVRWISKRNSLVFRNEMAGVCTPKVLEVPHEGRHSPYFVPALDGEALVQCLTVRDVKELAQFELPEVYNPPQFGERIGRQFEITPGALPRDPYWASILGQVLVFFVVIYFGAFAREAVSSQNFPTPGTLFGAFSGSRWTLLAFLVALWSPLLASLGLAISSHKVPLIVCSVAVFWAVFSAHRVLQAKRYFAALKPRFRVVGDPAEAQTNDLV